VLLLLRDEEEEADKVVMAEKHKTQYGKLVRKNKTRTPSGTEVTSAASAAMELSRNLFASEEASVIFDDE
jgi:hypothetical protein